MRHARPWAAGLAALLLLAAATGAAQVPGTQFSLGTGGAAVVTLDQERMFSDSAFGQAVAAAVDRSVRALSEENRALEQELAVEERELTERRPGMAPDEFRVLADRFDDRVQTIRRRQEDRGRAIGAFREAQRQRFYEAALPVVTEVVVEAGAVAVLDSRAIVLALDEVDITDRVLARIDAVLGPDEVPAMAPAFDARTAPAQALPDALPDPDALPLRPRPRPPSAGGPPLDLPPQRRPG